MRPPLLFWPRTSALLAATLLFGTACRQTKPLPTRIALRALLPPLAQERVPPAAEALRQVPPIMPAVCRHTMPWRIS